MHRPKLNDLGTLVLWSYTLGNLLAINIMTKLVIAGNGLEM